MSAAPQPLAAREGPLVEITGLSKVFPDGSGSTIHALRNVSLRIARGETLGLVGESGCGKTTLARCLLGLERPTSGSIRLRGRELVGLSARELRPLRRGMQIVFQNPTTSLNPSLTLRSAVAEPIKLHRPEVADPDAAAVDLLESVGLPRSFADRRPRSLSGGQRQRVGIARAIAPSPELLVLDEPTSSLDLSVRAQILRLLRELQDELGLTYLFISHDLGVIRNVADRVAVMYLGEIVEASPVATLVDAPQHPYTVGLLASVPSYEERPPGLRPLLGEASAPPPQGCPLHPRCPQAMDVCRDDAPRLLPSGFEHEVACFLFHPPTRAADARR